MRLFAVTFYLAQSNKAYRRAPAPSSFNTHTSVKSKSLKYVCTHTHTHTRWTQCVSQCTGDAIKLQNTTSGSKKRITSSLRAVMKYTVQYEFVNKPLCFHFGHRANSTTDITMSLSWINPPPHAAHAKTHIRAAHVCLTYSIFRPPVGTVSQ